MNLKFKRGDIVMYEPPLTTGSEQAGKRPWIIISNNVGNKYGTTLMLMSVTSQIKKRLPTHTVLSSNCGLKKISTATAEQVRTTEKAMVGEIVGHIADDEFWKIEDIIAVACGFEYRLTRLPTYTAIRNAEQRYA